MMRIATLAAVLMALISLPAIAEPVAPDQVRVIDEDTIRVAGGKPDVRLVGFNAPETRRAQS